MSIDECVIKLRKFIQKEHFTDAELISMYKEVEAIKKEFPLDYDKIIADLANANTLRQKEMAANKLTSLKSFRDIMAHIDSIPDEKFSVLSKKMGTDNQRLSKLDALLNNRMRGGKFANYSVANFQTTFHGMLKNPVKLVIDDLGITDKELVNEAFDLEVGNNLYHLNKKLPGFANDNKKAQALAKVYYEKTFPDMRDLIIAGGKLVGYLENYVGWRRYDREAVAGKKESFINWFLSDRMSAESFEPGTTIKGKKERAEQAWDHIVHGNQGDFSKHRSIHFDNYADEQAFLKEFGYFHNHYESTQAQMQTIARKAGLMKVFGPNYKEVFDKVLKWADPTGKTNLTKHTFDDLSGALSNSHETNWSRAAATFRSFTSLQSLPNASITAFMPDQVAAAALASTIDGRGIFSAMHSTVSNYVKTASKSERLRMANAMALHSMDIVSTVTDGATIGSRGWANKAVENMFRWNRLASHSDRMRTSLATTVGHILQEHVEKDFSALPENLIKTFDRYGINADNWSAIRKASVEVNGISVLSPTKVLELGLDKKLATDTFAKVGGMINELAKLNTLEGSAYSRQFLYRGTREGEFLGELMRFMGQFKQAGVNMVLTQGRLIHSMSAPAYGQAFGLFTLAGYLSYMAREITVNGTTPAMPDTDTDEGRKQMIILALESANRGAGGLLGDTTIANYNQSVRTVTGDIMGPAFNNINKLGKFGSGLVRGENNQNVSEEINYAQSLVTGLSGGVAGAAFIKPVIQGLIIDQVHNMTSSNYTMNRTRKLRNRGQYYIKDLL